MTLFEWKFKEGWIWITPNENKNEHNPSQFAVFVDPTGFNDWYFHELTEQEKHGVRGGDLLTMLANLEYTGEPDADKILALWRSMGSPVVDRKAPGYIAAEFPSDFVWHVYAKGGAE